MTVVISKFEMGAEKLNTASCAICGDTLRRYPFLFWLGEVDIHICGHCCAQIKDGLTADLIHIEATIALQRISPGYAELVLQKVSPNELKAQDELRKRWESGLLRDAGLDMALGVPMKAAHLDRKDNGNG